MRQSFGIDRFFFTRAGRTRRGSSARLRLRLSLLLTSP
jgi:hypothetical protein